MADIPTLTGRELYRLLIADGWEFQRHTRHGDFLTKTVGVKNRTTLVKNNGRDIPKGTLAEILSQRQTGLGRDGLIRLIERRGL